MTIAEIKRRREETLAREKSLKRHYQSEMGEIQDYLEWLQDQCPHDGGVVTCEVCGALIDGKATQN